MYEVQIMGRDDCFYHVMMVETKRKVFEMLEGVYVDVEMGED